MNQAAPLDRTYKLVRWVTVGAAGFFALMGLVLYIMTGDAMLMFMDVVLAGVTLLVGFVWMSILRRGRGRA